MALAAQNPADRVEQLLLLTKRLTELVERETHLFDSRRPLEAAPFRDEKAKLANIYRQETARVAKEPALIAMTPPDARDELTAATQRLTTALDAHGKALAALQTLTEGLVRSIADHVAAARTAQTGYGPNAKTASDDARTAITLSQTA